MDSLSRLTDTYYAETGTHESTTLDSVGNREAYTSRGGEQIDYTLANPANQYATIGGANIDYDPAGNLSVDEVGRSYFYEERNRLIEVWAPGGTTPLAGYTYDALGRRTSFADPVVGVTTYYYYAGKQVIEEYSAAGTRLRYHINGAQYIDEQIATYDEATGEFTYYLAGEQFSVIGTGNADGSVIEARGYSVGGDFSGAGACADFDADGDVDADDFAALEACFSGPDVPLAAGCEAADLDGDGDVDGMDYARFQLCMSGEDVLR